MRPRSDGPLGPEFSRPCSVETMGEDEVIERIEATAAERAALARRLDVLSLDRLTAVLRVRRPEGGTVIEVAGQFEAEVTQACVVSLAPLRRQVAEDFTALYSLGPAARGDGGPVEVDALADDPPETLGPDGLDLGEAVVQQLAVTIDPYPRDEAATLEALGWGGKDRDEAVTESPFKGLEILTRGR
jgi:Large ribosomal RNA subunit accumulation protein YceD